MNTFNSFRVFFNFTPNSPGGKYYFPKSPYAGYTTEDRHYQANNSLLSRMMNDALSAEGLEVFRSYTYKIYDQYIDIPQLNNNSPRKAIDITYVALNDGDKILFYFVDRVLPLPQGYRLYTRIDYWATYISATNITNVVFKKSNLQVGNGNEYYYYTDEVINFDLSRKVYLKALNRNLTRANISVLAVIKHKVYQNFNDSLEVINVYGFKPADIAARYNRTNILASDIYELISEVLNIYAISEGTGQGTAQILKAYLYDNASYVSKALLEFDTISTNGTKQKLECWEMSESVNEYNIDIINNSPGIVFNPDAIALAANTYIELYGIGTPLAFGTKYNNIKLPPFVLTYSVKARYEIGKDYFRVFVSQGQEERDITTAFEVGGIANTGTLTALQAAAKWLGIGAQAAGGAFQISKGGAGIVSGTAAIGNAITGIVNQNGGTVIGSGNGVVTFNEIIENDSGEIWHFIHSSAYAQGAAQGLKILSAGAFCDIPYQSPTQNLLSYLSGLKPLYKGISAEAKKITEPYIVCEATVDNVPYEAIDTITNALAAGIRIIYYGN